MRRLVRLGMEGTGVGWGRQLGAMDSGGNELKYGEMDKR